ncbi:MAG: transglutaminase-like domain-containing protein [Bacillota bacterium]
MRLRRFLGVFLVLAFMSLAMTGGIAAAKEKCLREVWSIAEQDDKPVGFGFDQVWRTKDGYRYVSEATIQISFLGSKATVATQYMEAKVDRNYLAQSYLGVFNINGSRTQIKAEFSNEEVKVVTLTADGKETVKIQKITQPLYFASSYLDFFLKKGALKVGATAKSNIWDIGSLASLEYSITVNEKTSYRYNRKKLTVFKITEKSNHEVQSLIDKKGNYYSGYDSKLDISFRRVKKGQIPELKTMNLNALLVPGNRRVNFPFRSIFSKIKVKWGTSLKLKEFEFNDNRQKLISHQSVAAKQEAILEIKRERRDFSEKVVLPLKEPALAPYLADVQYITPSAPAVQKLSRQILNGETDGWRATQKLTKWVFEYIKPAMIPETLTTKQILEGKTGKCVEYAVLFAALARAAGLPTRVVLGERYQDNVWIGHLWNEVWLGEWVAIDASHNQVAPDALLLKFIASDTILGAQKVRVGLIGELEIEILDVRLQAADKNKNSALKTGIDGQIYTNADFKCRMIFPEGWKLLQGQEQGMPELVVQNRKNFSAANILLMFNVPQGTAAEMLLSSRISMLKNALPEFTLLKEEKQTLKEYPAAVGTWKFTHSGAKIKQQNWIVIRDDIEYLLVFQASGNEWQQYEPEFQKMREQFMMLE